MPVLELLVRQFFKTEPEVARQRARDWSIREVGGPETILKISLKHNVLLPRSQDEFFLI